MPHCSDAVTTKRKGTTSAARKNLWHQFCAAVKLITVLCVRNYSIQTRNVMKNFFNTVFFALIILFFVLFSLSNAQSLQLNFFGTLLRPFPVSLLILMPFLVGIVLGSILDLVERLSLRKKVRKLKNEIWEKTHGKDSAPSHKS